jgi:hypothetical protein
VTRHLALAAAVAAAALSVAAALPSSGPALLGVGIAAVTGFASLVGFGLFGRSGRRPLQAALAVFAVMFLVRVVALALGVVAVTRAGWSPLPFALAFIASYLAFAAIEGGFVHALGRRAGKSA